MLAVRRWILVSILTAALSSVGATTNLLISELLFNPPGSDIQTEYVELRGDPNGVVPAGTFLVSIEGDEAANPGTVRNVFDLSGTRIGGNGFLVLLQKESLHRVDPRANTYMLAGIGEGWTQGALTAPTHNGYNGFDQLENPSITFLLGRAASLPVPGEDLDQNNDGELEKAGGWMVWDSVGILDNTGAGDVAYGKLNFRRNTAPGNSALALGRVFGLPFTPGYVGRFGNSTGNTEQDWVAGDSLTGSPPTFALGGYTVTWPGGLATTPLSHLGSPNFGAAAVPGISIWSSNALTVISKGGAAGGYWIALNTKPAGQVMVAAMCQPPLLLRADPSASFGSTVTVILSNTAPAHIQVIATPDGLLGNTLHQVAHSISASSDQLHYPTSAELPPMTVHTRDLLLLNELKVNPPGEDSRCEFVELLGEPGWVLKEVQLLAINGERSGNPGEVSFAINLDGVALGSNGLLVVLAPDSPYQPDLRTTTIRDARFSLPGGVLGNDSVSLLLVSSLLDFHERQDLDENDDGILEKLVPASVILDAVGWVSSGKSNVVYTGAVLRGSTGIPDAACRWPGDTTPNSATAWFFGDLAGGDPASVVFDEATADPGFPIGTLLSPGNLNRVWPWAISAVPTEISGVIGDAANPTVILRVSSAESNSVHNVAIVSTNHAVLAPEDVALNRVGADGYELKMEPRGVGYTLLTVTLWDEAATNSALVRYAASAPGRPGGTWHLGASDGSTAIPLDSSLMLYGDDENQVLRVYPRRYSSLPLMDFNFTTPLQLPDAESGMPREVDIEASTRTGDRIFWIGSHGHSVSGESRTNRTRIFATELSGFPSAPKLTYLGRYDYLKTDLIQWDTLNMHGKGTNYYGIEASDAEGVSPKAPDGSGLAIEGLAMMPGDTNGALIGFRAPIIPAKDRHQALLLPVLNFAQLAASTGPPGSARFGEPIELDLYDRGIRSIEGNDSGYLIIAGAPGGGNTSYPRDFKLYTWTGKREDTPRERSCDLDGLNPEGIIELPPADSSWEATSRVNLLSDNGTALYYGDGVPAKSLPVRNFKKCRSDWVELGWPVWPMPFIVDATALGTNLRIRWRSLRGLNYRVLSAPEPTGSWQQVSGLITADDFYAQATVPGTNPGNRSAFFRVECLGTAEQRH